MLGLLADIATILATGIAAWTVQVGYSKKNREKLTNCYSRKRSCYRAACFSGGMLYEI